MPNNFYKNKKVLITGGTGFVGSHLAKRLIDLGAQVIVSSRNRKIPDSLKPLQNKLKIVRVDLRDPKKCLQITKNVDIVMHLAKVAKGLNYNTGRQGLIYIENMVPFINILESARLNNVERFLTVSSVCIYPRVTPLPTTEEHGFDGIPEISNIGYGWAKRMQEFLSQQYAQEYGMKIAIARMANAYGPGDDFSKDAHVIPSLIKRILTNENPFVVWGDGNQTRSFLYVDDFVEGLLTITEKYPTADPLNIGPKTETSIKDILKIIMDGTGKHPQIIFDTTKPVGQQRRKFDIKKAEKILKYKTRVNLKKGIQETIKFYMLTNKKKHHGK